MTPEELRTRRKALRLSQAALAEAIGVDQRMISRWELRTALITVTRSAWLDQEMQRIERERKPKRRRTSSARPQPDGAREGERC